MVSDQHDVYWTPVARFIGRLPALTDLDYSCSPQLAPCLLTAIEAKARCRLSLGTFALRSFMQRPMPAIITLNPHETRLATSPNLHSLTLCDVRGTNPYILKAVRYMAAGCAPNLRKVSIKREELLGELVIYENTNASEPEWQGEELRAGRSSMLSSEGITSFELACEEGIRFHDLQAWTEAIDFGILEDLRLHGMSVTSLVAHLAEDVNLDSLKTLVLTISYEMDEPYDEQEIVTLNALAAKLLRKIPALHTLSLSGLLEREVLSEIVKIHGNNLRKLTVMPCHDGGELMALASPNIQKLDLPNVQELSIPTQRRLGSDDELRAYRTIAECFPRLKTLRLFFDCNDESRDYVNLPGYKEERFLDDSRLYIHDDEIAALAYALLNHAVDADLILSIFHYINRYRPRGFSALARLEVRVVDKGTYRRNINLRTLCSDLLGKSLACCWKSPGDIGRGLVIEEIDGWSSHDLREEQLQGDVREAFRSLWPFEDGQDWSERWKSYPLREV
ncbi:hypothetical protein CKM354_001083700 [Cercospora kikuchii]|nr:uncharacterized protein CKM354_001083700 [Cercospora kikuchii]GIZ47753.1 hypothetical protein CKM354_001083700 [Cercospora kikuchii]